MARITIEDCIDVVSNRFRLVMYGAQRGREIASGVEPVVALDKHIKHEKNAVIALREIAQGHFDEVSLEESIVRSHRRFTPIETDPDTEHDQVYGNNQEAVAAIGGSGTPAGTISDTKDKGSADDIGEVIDTGKSADVALEQEEVISTEGTTSS